MTKSNNSASKQETALDDLMIAMDVVDTLRHDERIIDRELNDDQRREDLIKQLKELYKSQGIDVPNHVLEEGVQALEDDRFVYKPPKESFFTWLAKLYVSRESWGKNLLVGLAAIVGAFLTWQIFFEMPKERAAEKTQVELTQTLPGSLNRLMSDIRAESLNVNISVQAERIGQTGLRAAKAKSLAEARSAEQDLKDMLKILRQEYKIKVVSKRGVPSGVTRIPKINKKARNYYLIVEAVDKKGTVLPQKILSEETGKREEVKRWGVRVPKSVYDAISADKKDDGIIQKGLVAVKQKGYVAPKLLIKTSGQSITRW